MANKTMVSPNRDQGPQYLPLPRQASLYNNSNFDEVQQQEHAPNTSFQQSNLGGFEDFLVRAGATINLRNQDTVINNVQSLMTTTTDHHPVIASQQPPDWLPLQIHQAPDIQYQQQHQQQLRGLCPDFGVTKEVYENQVMEINFPENPMSINSMPMAAMSSTSSDSQSVERKRPYSDEMLEKSIERRQKRMIKNRESAARSRARKQAYTNRLENEKFRLQKANNWLRRLKEVEARLFPATATPLPKYQLRRTSSASF